MSRIKKKKKSKNHNFVNKPDEEYSKQ